MPKGRHTMVTLAIAIGLLAAVLFAVIARRSGAEKAYAPVRGGDSDDEGESVTDVEMGGERRRGNARGSRAAPRV